jgi:hypothetical protein
MADMKVRTEKLDGGYGWVILVVSFVSQKNQITKLKNQNKTYSKSLCS